MRNGKKRPCFLKILEPDYVIDYKLKTIYRDSRCSNSYEDIYKDIENKYFLR